MDNYKQQQLSLYTEAINNLEEVECLICENTFTTLGDEQHAMFGSTTYKVINGKIYMVCLNCLKRILFNHPWLFSDIFQDSTFKSNLAKQLKYSPSERAALYKEAYNKVTVSDEYFVATLGKDYMSNICHTPIHKKEAPNLTDTKSITPTENKDTNIKILPKEIYDYLSEYVIGQEDAKEVLSVAGNAHYCRINNPDLHMEKDNVMLIGPTGTGKTILVKMFSKAMGLPCAIIDASTLTVAGYAGSDIESILVQLHQNANGDIEKAQKGVVFIDEIDKLASTNRGDAGINTTGVQQGLLKMIEGSEYLIPKNGNLRQPDEMITIETSNILFIFGGAFVGLNEIVNPKKVNTIGFAAQATDELTVPLESIETTHLQEYGFIPELIGRISTYTRLKKLDESMLLRILTEPKDNVIEGHINKFSTMGINVSFSDDALHKIARIAASKSEGARSLKAIMSRSLHNLSFNIPGSDIKEYKVTSDDITEKTN